MFFVLLYHNYQLLLVSPRNDLDIEQKHCLKKENCEKVLECGCKEGKARESGGL
jgi:hypothetical protein